MAWLREKFVAGMQFVSFFIIIHSVSSINCTFHIELCRVMRMCVVCTRTFRFELTWLSFHFSINVIQCTCVIEFILHCNFPRWHSNILHCLSFRYSLNCYLFKIFFSSFCLQQPSWVIDVMLTVKLGNINTMYWFGLFRSVV